MFTRMIVTLNTLFKALTIFKYAIAIVLNYRTLG